MLQAISKSGSFWGAAERLDLTPSTVSQQMSSLEAVTGVRLVERQRGRRRVELTPAGHLLLRHADAILARVKAAESDFSAFRAGIKGVLRVGTYQSIGARILPSVLPKFATEWPGIEVQLVEGLPDQLLLTMVESGELDVTFDRAEGSRTHECSMAGQTMWSPRPAFSAPHTAALAEPAAAPGPLRRMRTSTMPLNGRFSWRGRRRRRPRPRRRERPRPGRARP